MSQGTSGVDPRDRSPLGLIRTARLIWQLLQDARVPGWLKLIVPATLLYLIFPLDLLPDILVGPGQIDDLGIILIGLWLFLQLAPQAIVREYTGGNTGERARGQGGSGAGPAGGGPTVDVTYRVVNDEPPAKTEPPALPGPGEGTRGG